MKLTYVCNVDAHGDEQRPLGFPEMDFSAANEGGDLMPWERGAAQPADPAFGAGVDEEPSAAAAPAPMFYGGMAPAAPVGNQSAGEQAPLGKPVMNFGKEAN